MTPASRIRPVLRAEHAVYHRNRPLDISDPNAKVALVSENLGAGLIAGVMTLHVWFFMLIGAAASVIPNTVHNNMELYHSMKY